MWASALQLHILITPTWPLSPGVGIYCWRGPSRSSAVTVHGPPCGHCPVLGAWPQDVWVNRGRLARERQVSSGAGDLDKTVVSEPQWWPVPWSLQGREGSRSVVLVQVSAGDVPSGSRDLLPLSLLGNVGLMEIPAARETPVWAPDPPPGRQPRSEQPQGAGWGAHRLSLPAGSWKSSTASTAT